MRSYFTPSLLLTSRSFQSAGAGLGLAGFGGRFGGGRGALAGVVGNAVGLAAVPGDAPEPIAVFEGSLRRGPLAAVLREADSRLAGLEHFRAVIDRAAGDDHQPIVGRDRELGIAEVDALFADEGGRFPFLAVARNQDAELAVAADVAPPTRGTSSTTCRASESDR